MSARLMEIHRAAVREVLRVERTRKLWADPLALFPPDPVKVAVIGFNEGLRERTRDLRTMIAEVRERLAEVKVEAATKEPLDA